MPSLIINTCGISLLNGGNISGELRQLLCRHANVKTWNDMPGEVRGQLYDHAEKRHQQLLIADEGAARKLSAELNGLLSWQADQSLHREDM